METGSFDATAGPDRLSTADEIQAALSFVPDVFMGCAKDQLWEVESDLGGHVLIEREDDEVLTLLARLDPTAN